MACNELPLEPWARRLLPCRSGHDFGIAAPFNQQFLYEEPNRTFGGVSHGSHNRINISPYNRKLGVSLHLKLFLLQCHVRKENCHIFKFTHVYLHITIFQCVQTFEDAYFLNLQTETFTSKHLKMIEASMISCSGKVVYAASVPRYPVKVFSPTRPLQYFHRRRYAIRSNNWLNRVNGESRMQDFSYIFLGQYVFLSLKTVSNPYD